MDAVLKVHPARSTSGGVKSAVLATSTVAVSVFSVLFGGLLFWVELLARGDTRSDPGKRNFTR